MTSSDMENKSGEIARDKDDALLERAFEAARQDTPVPDAQLLRRIMDGAEDIQATFAPAVMPDAFAQRVSLGALLVDALGGFRGLGGLAAASVFGLWLGLSPALGIADFTQAILGGASLDATSALDADYVYLADLGDL